MAVTAAQLQITVTANTKDAETGLKAVGDNAEEASGGLKGFLGNMLGIAGGIGVVDLASQGFGFLKDQLGEAISAGMSANQIMAQTVAGLQSTHDASGQTAQSVADLATHLMSLTGIQDDAVQTGENMLLTFTNIGANVFPQATQAVADMATKMNGGAIPSAQQMQQAALQLGKALNDPATGMSALQRVGITFTQSQKDQITQMEKAGDTAGAQKIILGELSKEMGGSAEAAGHANGGIALLTAQMDNAKQTIGQALIPIIGSLIGAVLPLAVEFAQNLPGAIKATISDVKNIISFFQSASPAADAVKVSLVVLAGALVGLGVAALVNAIPAIIASVAAFGAQAVAAGAAAVATLAAALPFILVGAAIALLIVGIVELVQHWTQVSAFLTGVWNDVVTGVGAGFSWLGTQAHNLWNDMQQTFQNGVNFVKGLIQGGFDLIKTIIQNDINAVVNIFSWLYNHNYYFKDLVDFIVNTFNNAKTLITNVWNAISGFLTGVWDRIKTDVTAAFTLIKNTIQTDLAFYQAIISSVWNTIVNTLRGVWNTISGDARNVWNGISDFIGGLASRIGGAVNSGVINPIRSAITGLASQAEGWGRNLIQMFINGISGMIGNVRNAASNLMGQVKNILGFHSPAAEGPGSDADTWAPNLMKMFASGISGATPQLQSAASQAIGAVKAGLAGQSATASLGVNASGFLNATTGGLAGNAGAGVGAAAGVTQQITLYLDSRTLAQGVVTGMPNVIRLGTGLRNW